MLKKIESIRKKPPEVRNRYAFGVAFAFTFVVVTFWLVSMPARFNSFTTAWDTSTQKEVVGGFSQSFASVKASVIQGIQQLKENTPDTANEKTNDNARKPDIQEEDVSSFTFTDLVSSSSQKRKQNRANDGKKILIATSSKVLSTSSVDY